MPKQVEIHEVTDDNAEENGETAVVEAVGEKNKALQKLQVAADTLACDQTTDIIQAQAELIKAAKIELPAGYFDVRDMNSQPTGPSTGEQLALFFQSLSTEGQIAMFVGVVIVLCVIAASAGFGTFVVTTGICVFSYFAFQSRQTAIETQAKAEVKINVGDMISTMQTSRDALAKNVNEKAVELGKDFLETVKSVHKIKAEVQIEDIHATNERHELSMRTEREIKELTENGKISRATAKIATELEVSRIVGKTKVEIAGRQAEVERLREATKERLEDLKAKTLLSTTKIERDSNQKVAEIDATRARYVADRQVEGELQRINAELEKQRDQQREETARAKLNNDAAISRARIDADVAIQGQVEQTKQVEIQNQKKSCVVM